jgi:hypothetical protein
MLGFVVRAKSRALNHYVANLVTANASGQDRRTISAGESQPGLKPLHEDRFVACRFENSASVWVRLGNYRQ